MQLSSDNTVITFWGTRGSVATPGPHTEKYGGNTSCVSVKHNDSYFLFDAGTGIRAFGDLFLKELQSKTCQNNITLLLSHTHWDHIQGLPFFSPAYNENVRLDIFSRIRNAGQLRKLLTNQMEQSYFPVPMSKMNANINIQELQNNRSSINGVMVETAEHEHPGGSSAFKITSNGHQIVYSTDNELNLIFDEEGNPTNNKAKRYLDFISGVDLLIADGQYTDEEYTEKVGWGHSTISRLIKVAEKAQAKKLAIFHHDPYHSDQDLDEISQSYFKQYEDKASSVEFFWATEGMCFQL